MSKLFDLLLPFKGRRSKDHLNAQGRRALIITSSHATLDRYNPKTARWETSKKATGVHASELTEPYYVFQDAGMDVAVASIQGGRIPLDPLSLLPLVRTASDLRLKQDKLLQEKVAHAIPISKVDPLSYDLVFLSGGWAAAYDMEQSEQLGELITAFHRQNKVIASVCHGALGLCRATKQDGSPLIAGLNITGVSNRQLKQLGVFFTPKHPETEIKKRGGIYQKHGIFMEVFAHHLEIDKKHRLVTAQNQKGAIAAAEAALELLMA